MSLHGKNPREFLILLSPPGGLRRIQQIPGIILQKQNLNCFICMSILVFVIARLWIGRPEADILGGSGRAEPPGKIKF